MCGDMSVRRVTPGRLAAADGGAVSTRREARSRVPTLLRAVSVIEHPFTGYTFEF